MAIVGTIRLSDVANHPRKTLSAAAYIGLPDSHYTREIARHRSIMRREERAINQLQQERSGNEFLKQHNRVKEL